MDFICYMNYTETFEKCYARILNFLAYMPRTESEVKSKLERLYFSGKYLDIDYALLEEKILQSLKELKLIDDTLYVQIYISGIEGSSKNKSISQIRNFLYKKGINKELIEDAVGRLDENYEFNRALALASKKVKDSKLLADPSVRKKLVTFLLGKGFSSNVCYSVVDSMAGLK